MCVRIYPEIPVAMDVLSKIKRLKNEGKDIRQNKISIEVSECLKIQDRFSSFFNVFTSPEGSSENWKEDDYEKYFKNVKCFQSDSQGVFKLNTEELFEGIDLDNMQKIRECLRQHLIVDGAYSGRTIAALGL